MPELDTESVLAELCIAFAEELTAATVFLEFAEAAAAILLKTDGDGEPIVPVGRTGNGPTMDDETVALIEDLKPPVNYTDKEMKHVIDLLNKVCVESIDPTTLRATLRTLGGDPADLGGLTPQQPAEPLCGKRQRRDQRGD